MSVRFRALPGVACASRGGQDAGTAAEPRVGRGGVNLFPLPHEPGGVGSVVLPVL